MGILQSGVSGSMEMDTSDRAGTRAQSFYHTPENDA
jgi:hypothetical protein